MQSSSLQGDLHSKKFLNFLRNSQYRFWEADFKKIRVERVQRMRTTSALGASAFPSLTMINLKSGTEILRCNSLGRRASSFKPFMNVLYVSYDGTSLLSYLKSETHETVTIVFNFHERSKQLLCSGKRFGLPFESFYCDSWR